MGVTNQEDQLFVSKNNLRQIGLALNNYHDMWNTIPPASIASADGTIQLTPGFAILPFLDNAKLYNQVVAAGGMSSPQNQALLSQPLFYWKSPAASHDATGPDAHFAWNSNVFKPEKTMQMSDIKDGWTNTLAIGEVMAGFKPWYAADNTRDPSLGFGATPEKFGGPFSGGVHFITMDGSVKFISDKIDPQVLKAISTPNGGETVAPF